jgi:hypothetical protein
MCVNAIKSLLLLLAVVMTLACAHSPTAVALEYSDEAAAVLTTVQRFAGTTTVNA